MKGKGNEQHKYTRRKNDQKIPKSSKSDTNILLITEVCGKICHVLQVSRAFGLNVKRTFTIRLVLCTLEAWECFSAFKQKSKTR